MECGDEHRPAEQLNAVTSFLDASQVVHHGSGPDTFTTLSPLPEATRILSIIIEISAQVYGSTEKVASALRGKAVGKNKYGRLLQNSRWQGFAVPTMDDLGN